MDADKLISMVESTALRRVQIDYPEATSIQPSPNTGDEFDPIAATCWYIACGDAEQVRDMSLKEVARIIVDGESFGGPYRTKEDIEEWCKLLVEANEDSPEEAWVADLQQSIDHHFGLPVDRT